MRGAVRCKALYVVHIHFFENDMRVCEPDTVEWIGIIVVEIGPPQASKFF